MGRDSAAQSANNATESAVRDVRSLFMEFFGGNTCPRAAEQIDSLLGITPHSTRRSYTADPFVTLSLPGVRAQQSSGTSTNATTRPAQPTPLTKPKTTRKAKKPASTDSENPSKLSLPSPVAQSSVSSRRDRNSLQHVDPTQNVQSKVITLKYKKSSENTGTRDIRSVQPPSTPRADQKGSTKTTPEHGIEVIDASQSRRASTSSLTDKSTRSSKRARKLTSKAQALVGTKLYTAAQPLSDAGSPTPIEQLDAWDESGLDESVNADQSGTTTPTPITVEPSVAETPVPSVETTLVRSSTRERKPTTRAIEHEAEKVSRKRTRSPASIERAAKVARTSNSASKKLSNLRYSTAILPDTPPPDSEDTNLNNSKVTDITDTLASEVSRIPTQSAGLAETISLQSPMEPGSNLNATELDPKSPPPTVEPSQEDATCDLTCLSPSIRLYALAKIAADWPDGDESDEDDEALLEFTSTSTADGDLALAKVRELYCRCGTEPNQDSAARTTQESSRGTSLPGRIQRSISGKAKASNSKVSGTDTDSTIQPTRLRSKPNPHSRALHKTTAAVAANKSEQGRQNKRRSNRSITKTQIALGEQDLTSSEYEERETIVEKPRLDAWGMEDLDDRTWLDIYFPSDDETYGNKNGIKNTPQKAIPSEPDKAVGMSGNSSRKHASKGGKGSAAGKVRELLQTK